MPSLPLSAKRYFMLIVLLPGCLCTPRAAARNPKPSKYPLHVHVLASDAGNLKVTTPEDWARL